MRRQAVVVMRSEVAVSERRACGLMGLWRATCRYRRRRAEDERLRQRFRELAHQFRRFGYRRLHHRLVREGWRVNHKRVGRLYRLEGLQVRKRRRKRCYSVPRLPLPVPTGANQVWSVDFMADTLSSGRKLRTLNVVDVYTRECLAIEVGQSLKGHDVVRVLQQISQQRGVPRMLFCDNGSEFTSQVMDLWAYHNGVRIDFSRPGKPTDNAYVERFNGTLRSECLDAHWFGNLAEACQRIEAWRTEYNASRPHRALGEQTPNEFARQIAASRDLPLLSNCRRLTLNLVQQKGTDH